MPPTAAIYYIGFAFGLAFYFLPTIVAFARGAERRKVVAVVDVLLGWSIIGWVVALVMACGRRG